MECPYRVDTQCSFADCCTGSVCDRPEDPEIPLTESESAVVFRAGMRIKFRRDLTANATEEHPAFIYARKGEGGRITRVGGCWEGFWVKWDEWLSAAFGCQSKDFEKT